jgi:glycine/D-amino acid oxidase-like deaminating enzyme
LWIATSEPTGYGPLERDPEVDVAVVGGGIIGITTALLAKAGRRVAVLEADRVAGGVLQGPARTRLADRSELLAAVPAQHS